MKVTLIDNVKGLGMKGDICEVGDGFAMNFLIPNRKAINISDSQSNSSVQKIQQKEKDNELLEEEYEMMIKSVPEMVEIETLANEKGVLFSAINKAKIVEEMKKNGIKMSEQILPEISIKKIGEHKMKMKKGDVEKEVTLIVKNKE